MEDWFSGGGIVLWVFASTLVNRLCVTATSVGTNVKCVICGVCVFVCVCVCVCVWIWVCE